MTSRLIKALYPLSLSLCTLSTVAYSANGMAASPTNLDEQRALYDQAQQLLDQKNVEQYREMRDQIANYPLTPYVDYRSFLVTLKDQSPAQVERFIEQHQRFPFSKRIRAPYIDMLARNKQWQTLIEFQTDLPRGEQYQCHYYNAQYQTGNRTLAFKGAETLWLSGDSVSDACDPLFKAWEKAGLRTDEKILQRMLLSFEARNGGLLKYLAKQLSSDNAKQQANDMMALFNKPENVAAFAKKQPADDFHRQQSEMALKKLARKNVEQAQQAWEIVVDGQKLSQEQAQRLADYIAFRLFNTTDVRSLLDWRDDQIATTESIKLKERRVRLALQDADWQGVVDWIERLPAKQKETLRWQYWLARAEVELGNAKQGNQRLEAILGERNFYSVAAADALNRPVVFPQTSLAFQPSVVQPFTKSLLRIQELIARDKIAAAKSEWRHLLSEATLPQKQMLSAYAAQKRWHHLTVVATIQAKQWGNLKLRFPLAHRWWFNFYGKKHNVDPITLMSLARQESAMDIEARSPVGARGVMQIMPTTAKYTARKYDLGYDGVSDLYQVDKNIEIGSRYLQSLLDKYDNNRVFAFAAYNAGPGRVKTWRGRTQEKLDAYAFIEAIPFNETRGYVQNILMFETYYRVLLDVDGAFLNPHEMTIKY
ncbi:murein transglycosylase [Vibrio renipiscarius]|uniref:Lytic murein transglycosylase n=1 Tax=Vibrio renipiscarius TaxID=1461322 RepID=A0A0C2NTB5_9VIBR|nr:murein transglycosylase [Vibrio renipiscarius]KII77417.1 lytic murein transglycosylase [Vibrio renipiscarius]KII81416.1 lytic murein transglycosylase [Vibrio renipiscarius]